MMCRPHCETHDGPVLVVAGDSPLMQADRAAAAGRIRAQPAGLHPGHAAQGRSRRAWAGSSATREGNFLGIVEHKDATEEQRRITEVNMSYYVFNCRDLLQALDHIAHDNRQGNTT